MWIDTHLVYAAVSAIIWFCCMGWMAYAIIYYDLYHFFIAFALLWLSPIILETLLNIWGFLTTSSLRAHNHREECEKLTEFKFPIIYTEGYRQNLFWLEKLQGIDSKLSYYVYRLLEEEEILDTKEEEAEWFSKRAKMLKKAEKEAKKADKKKGAERDSTTEAKRVIEENRIQNANKKARVGFRDADAVDYYDSGDDDDFERRGGKSSGGIGKKISRDTFTPDGKAKNLGKGAEPDYQKQFSAEFQVQGEKNFYHEPESPSRAFLLEKLSAFYLLKMCYSVFLTIYLDIPALIFPAWFVRLKILVPQLKAAKGTVDGV